MIKLTRGGEKHVYGYRRTGVIDTIYWFSTMGDSRIYTERFIPLIVGAVAEIFICYIFAFSIGKLLLIVPLLQLGLARIYHL